MPHTPGPWTWEPIGEGCDEPCLVGGNGYVLLGRGQDESGDDRLEVNGDDMPLIAQAPAMYALLKELELITHVAHGFYCCPICGGEIEDKNRNRGVSTSALGHNTDCRLAAVLKAVEGE